MESMLWDYLCDCCHFLNLQSVIISLLSPLSQVLICSWNIVILSLVCLGSQELPPCHLLPEVPVQWKVFLIAGIISICSEAELAHLSWL